MAEKNVLVIDDEGYVRDLVREILEGAGHTVLLARNCEEATGLCIMNDFDVVLTDLDLQKSGGKKTGVEFSKELVEDLDKHPRIILMSGDFSGVKELGPYIKTIIQKPFSRESLIGAIG